MKRLLWAVLCASGLWAQVGPAWAQSDLDLDLGAGPPPEDTGRRRFESDQDYALELRFGPYSPDVDEEFDGPKPPHERIFGKNRRFMLSAELDYQIFQRFGSLAIGGSIGYFREQARAFGVNPDGTVTDTRSGDDTRLTLIPLAGLAVYRMDEGLKRWGFPLVPYVKAGITYNIWSIYDGNGRIAEAGNGRGRGATVGWQASFGAMLALDFIDTDAARAFDSESGINHTYVFFEFVRYKAPGLGGDKKLHVGDSTWATGLAFEF